jgi:hypothetical protein
MLRILHVLSIVSYISFGVNVSDEPSLWTPLTPRSISPSTRTIIYGVSFLGVASYAPTPHFTGALAPPEFVKHASALILGLIRPNWCGLRIKLMLSTC